MSEHAVLGPVLLFVLLLVLASVVAGLGAARRGLRGEQVLCFGAILFLAQLAIFVVLMGVGLPGTAAKGAAFALGVPRRAGFAVPGRSGGGLNAAARRRHPCI